MKRIKTLTGIIALLLAALLLTACGKSEFGMAENTAKRMTIAADNADKKDFFMVGSLEVEDGEQIVKEKAPLFLTQLVNFMRDRTEWTGTATELLENLNDPITPATMVKNQIVKYYCDILEPAGIVLESMKNI